jgi:hypothetical protein
VSECGPSDLQHDRPSNAHGIEISDVESISLKIMTKSSAGSIRRFLERKKNEHDLPAFAQNLKAALDRFQVCLSTISACLHFSDWREQSSLAKRSVKSKNGFFEARIP